MVEFSFDEFYQEKTYELVRFCDVYLHHRMINGIDAEDIVQKVVVKAWEKRHKLASHPNVMGWFVDACVKECRTLMRAEGYQRKHMGWAEPITEDMSVDAQQDVILRWLSRIEANEFLSELKSGLTPLENSVYEQYYVKEKSAKDAADALGLKVNAVNDAARRIRKRATALRSTMFILLISPIFGFFCSIFGEGRQ